MLTREIKVGSVNFGGNNGLVLIAGPCVIESQEACYEAAIGIKEAAARANIPFIFKSSFDKANRSSSQSFRGPGLKVGLEILAKIKKELKVPILTDVHEPDQCEAAAAVVDIIQIPAFLCRQTDLLIAAGKTGCVVNVKKGQFLAPNDMRNVIEKIRSTDNDEIMLTERGTSFGYHCLVNDMRGLPAMRRLGYPVIFDATHSVQIPGGQGTKSGGERQYVPALARAAVATGVDGVFLEAHPNPDKALSDGPNMVTIDSLPELLILLQTLDKAVRPTIQKENVEPRVEYSRGLTVSVPAPVNLPRLD